MKLTPIIRAFADDIEESLLLIATKFGPWLAPIGPAYFVGRAAYHRLEAHLPVAIAMALAVELVGFAATHTTLKCWLWNGSKRKPDPTAPTSLMVWLSLVYFVAALILSFLVEVAPESATYAPAVFIGLAGVAYVTIAVAVRLADWQTDRELEAAVKVAKRQLEVLAHELEDFTARRENTRAEIEKMGLELTQMKAQRKRLRQQLSAANGQNQSASDLLNVANEARKAKIEDRRLEVLRLKREDMSQADIARALGVSPDTIRRDLKALNGAVKGGAL